MFRKDIPYKMIPFVAPKDSDGNDPYEIYIDQFPSQDFNRGANGFPANDLTLLSRATSSREYEMILARLKEVQLQQPDNSKKTNKQIISEIMPSWVQTPSEIDKFMDWFNNMNPVSTSTVDVTSDGGAGTADTSESSNSSEV